VSLSALPTGLDPLLVTPLIDVALREDLGQAGDITSNALLAESLEVSASIVARQAGRICGIEVAEAVFSRLDPTIDFRSLVRDGDDVQTDQPLAVVRGRGRPVLAAERTALNFLGHLSGVSTATQALVTRIADYPARLVCTRKTTPGWRALEKYAVRVGGASNHRFGLHDAVLIKDNHRAAVGGITEAVRLARRSVGHLVKIELEIDHLSEIDEALAAGIDVLMLDNMPPADLVQAVERCADRVLTEASGGITAESIVEVAKTGVDFISVGWITHSAPALNVALDLTFD
jgi:nicotinate-nucleotide pyrophosphorylase (carboxylating)